MKKLKKYIPIVIIFVLALIIWTSGAYKHINFSVIGAYEETLQAYVQNYFWLTLAAYCASYILVVSLSIPGAAFMTILGGFLFGQTVGTISVVLSATTGATIIFLSARMASNDFLSGMVSPWLHKMKKGFKQNAFYYLLTLRLIPIFPFAAINLVTAFLQIPLKVFFWGTLIGIIPGTFIYVSIGSALDSIVSESSPAALPTDAIIALIGLGILALLPVLYKAFQKKRQ